MSKTAMTIEEHKERHKQLHRALDELLADWITHTGKLPSQGTILELLKWSADQTESPTETTIGNNVTSPKAKEVEEIAVAIRELAGKETK